MKTRAIAVTITAAALTAGALTAGALTAGPAGAASAASAKLHCSAAASPSHPSQYSNVDITVNSNKAHAHVHTVAQYKTTSTAHNATANKHGNATVVYDISDATTGFKVKVQVTVSTAHKSASCSTAFTPR